MATSKNQSIFVCSECGEEFAKWQGKCPSCGAWNTLKEFKNQKSKVKNNTESAEIINLADVKTDNFSRQNIGIYEVDRVLGGGIVPGSIVLLAGEPGIGKSTLLMQIAAQLENIIYVSGEESIEQIKMRADRLKVKSGSISIIADTNVSSIIGTISKLNPKPKLIIIDSIQTMYNEEYPSTAGSVVQVRESALQLGNLAKREHIPIIFVGHVTKEGTVAGPKTLEHMVDVVLNLEGEKYHGMRILRAGKNRFGSTDEIGIFEIKDTGLIEIKNPSKLFLDEASTNTTGSVVCAAIEGTRPILVEIQALTATTVFGYPKRTASGFDLNRLQLIIAILINRGSLNLGNVDVYLNISGGYTLKEPAADLAVALAIASSYRKKPIQKSTVVFGELALSGDIRPVPFEGKRIAEANRLGYTKTLKAQNIIKALEDLQNV